MTMQFRRCEASLMKPLPMPLLRLRHSHKEAKLKARHKMADLKEIILIIRESLGVSSVKDLGATGGGCISNSRKFQTENGNVFVKTYQQEKVSDSS